MAETLTPSSARRWLVSTTLLLTGVILLFFLLSPFVGYPLEFSQSMRMLEIVLPVFFGYLGSAALFVFRSNGRVEDVFNSSVQTIIGPLVKGPVLVFAIATVALLTGFAYANFAAGASGMSADDLAVGLTVILGLLAVTTNIMIAYLF